jgi:hypothetical protein
MISTVRELDTEFRASLSVTSKNCDVLISLFIVNVTFKNQTLKFIFCNVNRMSIKILANGKIEVNTYKAYFTFFDGIFTVMPEILCLELYITHFL